jgi:hypothetical protein
LDDQENQGEVLIDSEMEQRIRARVEQKMLKAMSGKYTLRNRKKAINYNEDTCEESRPHKVSWRSEEENPIASKLIMKKKLGYKKLKVLKSTIPDAGWGLFASESFENKDLICSYEGANLPEDFDESSAGEGRDYIAMGLSSIVSKGGKVNRVKRYYVDSWEEDSCYGRFVNDPLNDHLVNARIIMKGDKMLLMALEPIRPGQEIFISYGKEYWNARSHLLPSTISHSEPCVSNVLKDSVRFKDEVEVVIFQYDSSVEGMRVVSSQTDTRPMSGELEDMADAFYTQRVPDAWESVAYPSLKPLSAWVSELTQRCEFMVDWVDNGTPLKYWVSGFFFPQAFLTGNLQNYGKCTVLPCVTATASTQ